MSVSESAPLVATALLVLLGSLPAPRRGSVVAAIAALVVAGLAGALLVRSVARRMPWLPRTLPTQVARYGVTRLTLARERNVVLIDGGSYACRGVNDAVVQAELERRGYSASVVQLALNAGNHFERYRMYEDLLANLGSGPKPGQRWIYLAELQSGYGRRPLAQLAENEGTARAFHYMDPANTYYGLAALSSGGEESALSSPYLTIARHALVNAVNVGVASGAVPWTRIEPKSGYIAGITRTEFRFTGLDAVRRAAEEPLAGVSVPGWLFEIREPRERALFDGVIAAYAYYGIPSTRPAQMQLVRRACELTRLPCFAPADPALLRDLGSARRWHDEGHLSSKGAKVYSVWLATKLDESGLLRK